MRTITALTALGCLALGWAAPAATNTATPIPPPATGQVLASGHWVPDKVRELKELSALGPFLRLQDGALLTVPENSNLCRLSRDEGKTWTNYPVFGSPGFAIWSPVLVQTRSGTVLLGFSNGKEKANWNWDKVAHDAPKAVLPTYVVRSLDGGKTWRDLRKLHDDWTGMNRDLKETRSGSVVLSTMMMRHAPGRHTVLTYTSRDDGRTWVRSNVLDLGGSGDHAGVMESTLEQLKDGRLGMLLRTNHGCFWETDSTDDGLSWSAPRPTPIDASSSPGALQRLADGKLVLVWNRCFPAGERSYPLVGGDGNQSEIPCSWQREELSLMFSGDEGRTWTPPTVIAKNYPPVQYTVQTACNGKRWLAYPLVFEAKPGELWITTGFGGLKIALNEADFAGAGVGVR